MLLNKEMYQCIKEIEKTIIKQDSTGNQLQRKQIWIDFNKTYETTKNLLRDADLIKYEPYNCIMSITGNGHMTIEYYLAMKRSKIREIIMILLAIGTWLTAIASIIIVLTK
jgi:hypothetical protein